MLTLWDLVPLGCYYALIYLWLSADRSQIMTDHFITFLVYIGIIFGKMTTQISLHGILDMHFPHSVFLIMPLAIGVAIVRWSPVENM